MARATQVQEGSRALCGPLREHQPGPAHGPVAPLAVAHQAEQHVWGRPYEGELKPEHRPPLLHQGWAIHPLLHQTSTKLI
jgi:hypothetical protein